ncbi:MAG: sel1 repeat family protein [Deltaproteobacteria bacterium]|jgi:TPR repeat protein|nr:sel1 repeat family protein [Deltaproteobacteria bacterium]
MRAAQLFAVAAGCFCGFALVFAAAASGRAASFEDAVAAYQRADYASAMRIWHELGEAGDVRAIYNLGVLFDLGQGVTPDPARAAVYFQHAAQAGHARAMSNYGRLLEQGRGVAKNEEQAAHWFRQAAEGGLAEAQYNLGLMYERGRGVPKSDRDAAAWYSSAAAGGQSAALERLGLLYRDGRGVPHNATRATLLLYGAAMDGRQDAMQALEKMAPQHTPFSLFGQRLDSAERGAMRQALVAARASPVREDDKYACDVYRVADAVPGASELAACYGRQHSGRPAPLGFIKIDYPVPDAAQAQKIRAMVEKRFGPPTASEGANSLLWNLGTVIIATQYAPDLKHMALMYMVPKVYYLTRQGGAEAK